MIVLLTDFGQSEYVGVMKGVIYSIDQDAKMVDLCHDISPQNIIEASWILKNNYKFFPKGAIFCCVVDPGVGTERKALVVKTDDYYFVAPDNGLLWETLKQQKVNQIRQIPIPAESSKTFHGRDVFAGAAVNIEQGKFEAIGKKIEDKDIEKLEFYLNGREGIVVRIDRFGNIITNLPKLNKDKSAVCVADKYAVGIGQKKYTMPYYSTYEAAPSNELFLVEGSNKTLEISLKRSSVNDKLRLRPGERITID